MKKILIGVIACTILLAACHPNDDNEQQAQTGIENKWMIVSMATGGQTQPFEHKCASDPQGDYLQFNGNGSWESHKYTSGCSTTETKTGTYSKSGNAMTVVDEGGQTHALEITTLNSTTLTYEENVDYGNGAVTLTITYQRI